MPHTTKIFILTAPWHMTNTGLSLRIILVRGKDDTPAT